MSALTLAILESGLGLFEKKMANISNNLANLKTTGFKKQVIVAQERSPTTYQQAGTTSATGGNTTTSASIGNGVRFAGTTRIWSQGGIEVTDNPYDVAIGGNGFFIVETSDGLAYTRDGHFTKDSSGRLSTVDGNIISPGITIPDNATQINISKSGEVFAVVNDNPQSLGTIQLATFANPNALQSKGGNLFVETQASGPSIPGNPGSNGYGEIIQGALEGSNVNAVTSVTDMISINRAYEMLSKGLATYKAMSQAISSV